MKYTNQLKSWLQIYYLDRKSKYVNIIYLYSQMIEYAVIYRDFMMITNN